MARGNESQRTWQDAQEDWNAIYMAYIYLTGNKARIAEANDARMPGVSEGYFIEHLGRLEKRFLAERDALWDAQNTPAELDPEVWGDVL